MSYLTRSRHTVEAKRNKLFEPEVTSRARFNLKHTPQRLSEAIQLLLFWKKNHNSRLQRTQFAFKNIPCYMIKYKKIHKIVIVTNSYVSLKLQETTLTLDPSPVLIANIKIEFQIRI